MKNYVLREAPISERMWSNGDVVTLDLDKRQIRIGGNWFPYRKEDYLLENISTISRNNIEDCPNQATHCSFHPNGNIALFYRLSKVKFNDGTEGYGLEYLSSFNVWMGSNDRNGIFMKLTRII